MTMKPRFEIARDIVGKNGQRRIQRVLLICIFAALNGAASENVQPSHGKPGGDVAGVFAQARQGKPLRYVALGGSITQSGEGWIRAWLKEKFSASQVTAISSGMSATGSALGVFRLERDVIVHQPDLVAIEFCVNDGSLTDDEAIRYMESIVVRLKQLPRPPAIIVLEAAAKEGVNLNRHRRVAEHYGLLEVDLQAAADAELKKSGYSWETLFADHVHPNETGHRFYAKVIEEALEPFFDGRGKAPLAKLPPPLSNKKLILDGRLVPLSSLNGETGWKKDASPSGWMASIFNGTLSASEPGSHLVIPFRGTAVGIFYAMDKSFGSFDASVDDGSFTQVATNTRGGYSFNIFSCDLPLGEHILQVALPPAVDPLLRRNGPVKLGYLLLAGESAAAASGSEPAGKE